MKKLLAMLFSAALLLSLSAPVQATQEKAKAKAPAPARWEGIVKMKGKTLTVREQGSGTEKTIAFDSSTKWVSQKHGSKDVNTIDASQVAEGDRVICIGTLDKDGVLHATTISKRLSTGISQ